jgi:hypothetical protein
MYWDGPEEHLGILDLTVWKPMGLMKPAATNAAGANRLVQLIEDGRKMPVPEKLQPKRNFGHQWTEKNLISGGTSTWKKADGTLSYVDVQVTDVVTGASLYGYDTRKKTFTDPRWHGSNQINVQLDRKVAKMKEIKQILLDIEADEQKTRDNIDKWKDDKMMAAEKLPPLQRHLMYLKDRREAVQIRERKERVEMQAVQQSKAELIHAVKCEEAKAQKMEFAKRNQLPVPEILARELPMEVLQSTHSVKQSLDETLEPVKQSLDSTLEPVNQSGAEGASGVFEEIGSWAQSLFAEAPRKQEKIEEKYFGKVRKQERGMGESK